MSELNELISQIPIADVAAQLGVDEQTAKQAVEAAAPALVQGMQANAQDPAGAQSLTSALSAHTRPQGIASLADVDQQDGAKIVHNVFGANEDAVANRLSGAHPALGGDMVKKLLPMLAPIVIQWLASKWSSRGGSGANSGGITDILGDLLGNKPGNTAGGSDGSSGGLGDIFGKLTGGSGGLSDLLGGLLGGGKR